MKKVSTMAAHESSNVSEQKLTIGLDLGDRMSCYCVLDGESRKKVRQAQSAPCLIGAATMEMSEAASNNLFPFQDGFCDYAVYPAPVQKSSVSRSCRLQFHSQLLRGAVHGRQPFHCHCRQTSCFQR